MNRWQLDTTNKRLRVFVAIVLILSIVFAVRLVEFQVVRASSINEVSYENRAVTRNIEAVRGDILDANGEVLAKTVFRYDVNADPSMVGPVKRNVNGLESEISVTEQVAELAAILQLDEQLIFEKIQGTGRYSNLKKRVDAATFRELRELGIPWLYFDALQDRLYPSGAVAGNLLGFVGDDGKPLAGLERQLNSCLAGVDGQETFERSVGGVKIPGSAIVTQRASDGMDAKITIEADLQYFAQQQVARAVTDLKAEWGTAIVLEVKTGRILAAAEAPTVDPNDPAAAAAADRGARTFQAIIEPGSTIKTLTVASLIDTGMVGPETQVVAPYKYKLPWGDIIKDSYKHEDQRLTLTGVLRNSSNTGLVQIGDDVPVSTRFEYLEKFGLGKASGINFEGESGGIFESYKSWDGLTKLTTMFGQGMATTPLQVASAYQAIANGGERISPRLVDGCITKSGELVSQPKQTNTRVVSEKTAKITTAMLEKVVEQGGVGRYARISGYRVGGKSGTAQISEGAGYGSRHAISFVGYAPAEDPQYVVAITYYKPTTIVSSIGAVPSFKSIMQQVLRHYRVPPSTGKSADIATEW